jgi:hypothetical protein
MAIYLNYYFELLYNIYFININCRISEDGEEKFVTFNLCCIIRDTY